MGNEVVAATVERITSAWLAHPERFGTHLSLAVVRGGEVVAESYGPTSGPEVSLISWSMAKSITHALVGICVRDGLLELDAPAPVAEWADDERSAITLAHLLAMRSGLAFVEDYVDGDSSDVIDMLFGAGQHDTAGYAIAKPLAHRPGEVWSYSSGTTNIVARIVGDAVGGGATGMRDFMQRELFGPIGMRAEPRFDERGTFIGSSFVYASAIDFARFGELYLRDGVVDGQRILPEGWADHAATLTADDPSEAHPYGNHWWLWREIPGAFGAHGYECQRTIVVPDLDLVVVRLGKTVEALGPNVDADLVELIEAAR